MKYHGVTKVLIPWFDTEGMKQRTLLTITGTIDKRALIKGIKKFTLENFKKIVSQTWIMHHCMIINEHKLQGATRTTMLTGSTAMTGFSPEIEAWIKRLEDAPEEEDANQTGGHPESQGCHSEAAVVSLPDMSGVDGKLAAE